MRSSAWHSEIQPVSASAGATLSSAATPAAATAAPAKPQELKEYTMEEIAKHNKKTDCWVVLHGVVYDVTPFLEVCVTQHRVKYCNQREQLLGVLSSFLL